MEVKYWLFLIVAAFIFILVRAKKPKPTPRSGQRQPAESTKSVERTRSVSTERIRSVSNHEDQLYFVTNNAFQKRRIMNKSEYALFCKLERMLSNNHRAYRVFPQVSLGELLSSKDDSAYQSINSKRVDFAIINPWGDPCAVVEYQGTGHYQGNAEKRDAVKREACNKADIRFFEIPAQYSDDEIGEMKRYLDSIAH